MDFITIVPRIALGVVGSGYIAAVIPQEIITGWLGPDSGWLGVLTAVIAGAATPGGPVVGFSIGAVALKSGGGAPQVIAYVIAWALFAFQRLIAVGNPVHAGAVRLVPRRGVAAVPVPGRRDRDGDREAVRAVAGFRKGRPESIMFRGCRPGYKNEPFLEPPDARPEALCAGRAAPHRRSGQAQHQRKPASARRRARWRRSAPRRPTALRLYPDPEATALRAALAAYHGVRPEQVFVGNGSDEVLAHAFVALLKHDAPLLFPDITYSFYPVYCRLFGIAYETVPLDAAMRVRVADYRRPAGAHHPAQSERADRHRAAASRDRDAAGASIPTCPCVIDEAYVDFGAETAIPLIASHPNLLVVQTMSKSRALAGLARRLCDRRRRPDRGADAGQGQLQFLPAGPARPGRRHRLAARTKPIFSRAARSVIEGRERLTRRAGRARLRGAAVRRQFRLRAPSGA